MFLVRGVNREGEAWDRLFKEKENAEKAFLEELKEAEENGFTIEKDGDYFFTALDMYDCELFTMELREIEFED